MKFDIKNIIISTILSLFVGIIFWETAVQAYKNIPNTIVFFYHGYMAGLAIALTCDTFPWKKQ